MSQYQESATSQPDFMNDQPASQQPAASSQQPFGTESQSQLLLARILVLYSTSTVRVVQYSCDYGTEL